MRQTEGGYRQMEYCKGENKLLVGQSVCCPLREGCFRYKQEQEKGEIFFTHAPFRRFGDKVKCEFHKPINASDSIFIGEVAS